MEQKNVREIRVRVPADLDLSEEEVEKLAAEFASALVEVTELKPTAYEVEVSAKKKPKEKEKTEVVIPKTIEITEEKTKAQTA